MTDQNSKRITFSDVVIVVVIIGLLAAIIVPNVIYSKTKSKIEDEVTSLLVAWSWNRYLECPDEVVEYSNGAWFVDIDRVVKMVVKNPHSTPLHDKELRIFLTQRWCVENVYFYLGVNRYRPEVAAEILIGHYKKTSRLIS